MIDYYIKKNNQGAILGPYSGAQIRGFLIKGRVRRTDTVSVDKENWEPIHQVPQLIPEGLLNLD